MILIVLILSLCLTIGEASVDVEIGGALPNITSASSSGCPSFSEIPVAELHNGHPEKDFFYGGRFYTGEGNSIPALACNPDYYDRADGDIQSSSTGYFGFGSLMVNPGCSFYLFQYPNQKGKYVEYSGGKAGRLISKVPYPPWGNPCGGSTICVPSYLVTCQQKFPNCVPEDGWSTIATLDNTGSHVEAPFTFRQTIGTTWSSEVSESSSVSERVEASISDNFFGTFETSLGFSVETGMNWGSVTRQEKSKTETYTVGPIKVPGGDMVWVQAAVGYCDGSTVETHMYKIVSTPDSHTTTTTTTTTTSHTTNSHTTDSHATNSGCRQLVNNVTLWVYMLFFVSYINEN